jgi:hypothetical protein
MLMSILQDVGSYMGRAYENPNMGYLISTLLDARKLLYKLVIILYKLGLGLGLFRTRRSIEFQGPCSRNVNVRRSENCIFGIYGP